MCAQGGKCAYSSAKAAFEAEYVYREGAWVTRRLSPLALAAYELRKEFIRRHFKEKR